MLVQIATRRGAPSPAATRTPPSGPGTAGLTNGAAPSGLAAPPRALSVSSAGNGSTPRGRLDAAVSLRPGTFADVPLMADLINGYAAHGLMLPKATGQLYRTLREFVVAVDADGALLGCGALRIYDPGLAEVCSLAVADAARGLGVGRRVVEALHGEASAFGLARVFALTLEPGFFHRLGYETVEKSVLPQKIEADCVGCPRRDACNEIAVLRTLSPDLMEAEQ